MKKLIITFGQDQIVIIDKILTDLGGNHVANSSKTTNEETRTVTYTIDFKSIYSIYLFGYKQAKAIPF